MKLTAVITRVYQKDGIINLSKLQLDEKADYSDLEKLLMSIEY